MTVIGIHQPQYLPWLGLLDRASRCDIFVILDNVPYSKNYFYNRNRIKTANGPIWLTVPVLTKGHAGQTFIETRIDNKSQWGEKHWKGMFLAYKPAPFFTEYNGYFNEKLLLNWDILADFCVETFAHLLRCFNIDTTVLRASEIAVEGRKEELLINICRKVGATHYLSGPDGKNYLVLDNWKNNNLRVDFQEYNHPTYPQLHGEFVSNLSAVDLLFNCGKNGLDILTSNQPEYFADRDGEKG